MLFFILPIELLITFQLVANELLYNTSVTLFTYKNETIQSTVNKNKFKTDITWILTNFSNYQIIIHTDSPTFDFTLADISMLNETFIFYKYGKRSSFTRPIGYKFLNIISMEDPYKFKLFSSRRNNLKHEDIVLFLKRTDEDNKFWVQEGMEMAGVVFIYDIKQDLFSYVQYFVGNRSGLSLPVDKSSKLLDYVNTFKNFNRHRFIVGCSELMPFISCPL